MKVAAPVLLASLGACVAKPEPQPGSVPEIIAHTEKHWAARNDREIQMGSRFEIIDQIESTLVLELDLRGGNCLGKLVMTVEEKEGVAQLGQECRTRDGEKADWVKEFGRSEHRLVLRLPHAEMPVEFGGLKPQSGRR